jgi:hypothetical protein
VIVGIILFMLSIYSAEHGNLPFAALVFVFIIPGMFWRAR